MSVVNKMLQDLESRQGEHDAPSADYVPTAESRKGIWSIVVLGIVLLAAVGYWWYNEYLVTDPVAKATIYVATPPATNTRAKTNLQTTTDDRAEPLETKSQLQQPKILVQQPDLSQESHQQTKSNHNQIALIQPVAQESTIEDDEAIEQVSSFEFTASKSPNTEQALKQQIQVALQLNDDKEAIKLLKKLLQLKPENQLARKKLASLLFAQGMTNESKQFIETGIRLQPEVSDFRMMLARLYVQQKNTDAAHNTLREFNVSASLEPNFVSYRASLAKKLQRHDLAKLDYMNLLASQPSNAKWWLGLAISEEKLGDNSAALAAYKKVNELNQLSLEVSNFVQKRLQYLAGVL